MALIDYRDKPIPAVQQSLTALDYHAIPIDLDDPRNADPLVDSSAYGIASDSYYFRSDGWNAPYHRRIQGSLLRTWCRRQIAETLAGLNEKLRSAGLEILILDAYRPLAVQQGLWDFFETRAKIDLPRPTPEAIHAYVGQYCSDPSGFDPMDSRTWPTHMTGATIDLTLRRIKSRETLFMGSVYDDASEVSHTNYFEVSPHLTWLSAEEARRNRRLLFWTMNEGGLTNYPYEWWHYDFGTQMWAMNRAAYFGENASPWYGLPPNQLEAEESI